MTFWKSLEFRVRLDLGSGFVCVFVFKGRLWFPFKKMYTQKKVEHLEHSPKVDSQQRSQRPKEPRCQESKMSNVLAGYHHHSTTEKNQR